MDTGRQRLGQQWEAKWQDEVVAVRAGRGAVIHFNITLANAQALAAEKRELAFAEEEQGEGGEHGADPRPLDRRR